jgi:hypothetical protein
LQSPHTTNQTFSYLYFASSSRKFGWPCIWHPRRMSVMQVI